MKIYLISIPTRVSTLYLLTYKVFYEKIISNIKIRIR